MAESPVCENAPCHDVWCDDVRCGAAPPERERGPDDRVSWQWIAPLLSTLVTLIVGFYITVGAGLSQMACDAPGEAARARCESTFHPAMRVYFGGLALPLGLLVAGWALPRRRRNIPRRIRLAFLAPLSVAVPYAVFNGLVDWP
ncbi:hypothetical protein [Streptomyces botrytidirepellens]|uniref:hypothetical protein n=1 Tax=Streptomyces botrytidirepellens TaxID=2486417 RepID=UPI001FE72699|nr:hypothetical protein [Streptomyces botrytidirepellens]